MESDLLTMVSKERLDELATSPGVVRLDELCGKIQLDTATAAECAEVDERTARLHDLPLNPPGRAAPIRQQLHLLGHRLLGGEHAAQRRNSRTADPFGRLG